MKLISELLRLCENSNRTCVYKKFDGFDPVKQGFLEPFDVEVEYHYEKGSYSTHPYGEGSATEYHEPIVSLVGLKAAERVRFNDPVSGELMITFGPNEPLEELPGYDKSIWEFFQNWLDETVS
jgi:hypothetical protein